MTHQSELQLENTLMSQLEKLGFVPVDLEAENALKENLRAQLEIFNETSFSADEFSRIWNYLNKGDRFAKAKKLRDHYALTRDSEDVEWIKFFNTTNWCQNEYQVCNQITQHGHYENRYDVTLLVNGLPLAQIELKRRGVELKEAFNQVNRYHRHSFSGTLFEYVQIFVISNGVNTKYFANNPKQTFEQTFFWTDEDNRKITKLEDFAEAFLEKCALSEMIGKHIVLAESERIPMVLRPYQYYGSKRIIERVKESDKNGYIWHTTGSGKTLTSFKASQLIADMPEIKKTLFVVDRKDLDTQTTKEFNSFSDGSVDSTTDTKTLVDQLKDPKRRLVVTTIQKLDIAVKSERYKHQFADLADERVVIIFDECHRGQFGKTQARIEEFFNNVQMFGFTGTPIFADNNVDGVTTADVFDKALHKYIITNAISDNNVLGFAIEYVNTIKRKHPSVSGPDDEVVDIDRQEVLESDERLKKISTYLLDDWKRKTKNGKFNAIFAVSSIDTLKKYYRILREKKPDDFKIAAIFTYQANEERSHDMDDEMLDDDVLGEDAVGTPHSREYLETVMANYNEDFGTNYSTGDFSGYYKNLQKRVKDKEVDLVLVVNMFLTGFDSKYTNTLYLDKNLRYHGLVQAYSRTNRLHDSSKPHGNIVSFRNLKKETDEAIALFGDENAKETVFQKPYEEQKADFTAQVKKLKEIAPIVEAVDDLQSEELQQQFVQTFRELMRMKSSLETFAEFSFDDMKIEEQEFFDYQSKYLDIYDELRRRSDDEPESILDEVDFELELTVRDVVNYDYIIKLISGLKEATTEKARQKKTEEILGVFDRDARLRKKKDLVREFIEENLPQVARSEEVEAAFEDYWNRKEHEFLKEVSDDATVSVDDLYDLVGEYIYTDRLPRGEQIVGMLNEKPSILERQGIVDRIRVAISEAVEIFKW
jgi:type I restriction enzyme R subunit